MMQRHIAVLAAMAIGAGCSTPPAKPTDGIVFKEKTDTVNIPSKLLEKCKPLPALEAKQYTPAEVVDYVKDKALPVHDDCVSKDSQLVDIVRKAFNIKDTK